MFASNMVTSHQTHTTKSYSLICFILRYCYWYGFRRLKDDECLAEGEGKGQAFAGQSLSIEANFRESKRNTGHTTTKPKKQEA